MSTSGEARTSWKCERRSSAVPSNNAAATTSKLRHEEQSDGLGPLLVQTLNCPENSDNGQPARTDARVKLTPVGAKRTLVIRFSGLAGDRSISTKTAELRAYAARKQLTTVGEPILSFYNPPWTLPFFRRNEIMLELADGEDRVRPAA